jgi:Protein of unknown function (DUF4232)
VKLTPRLRPRTVLAASAVATAILLPAVALASSAGSDSASATAAAGRCVEGDLTDWIGVPGNATAGSVYYELEISDTSTSACTMYGFPGVSALGPGGVHLGSAAGRNSGYATEQRIRLQPGDTAHVVLQITDVANFPPSACKAKTADALYVYAPGDYSAKTVPFSFQACSKAGPVFLHVSTSIAGTGIPGYSIGE